MSSRVLGSPAGTRTADQHRRLPRRMVALLAVTTGAAVANLYYIQPLLNVVAHAFGVSDGMAGLLVTCTQIGYVASLVLLVPLGDLAERRGLITTLLLGTAAAAAICAAAPGFGVLAAALVAIGVLSAVAQIVVPLSATLAAPGERGQVVGTVMSGLLIGILLARTLSGLVAGLGGWRLCSPWTPWPCSRSRSCCAARCHGWPPPSPRATARQCDRSWRSSRRSPCCVSGWRSARWDAGFSVLWTSIAFLLGGPPTTTGKPSSACSAWPAPPGRADAPVAGRLADRGHGRLVLSVLLLLVLASWPLLALGGSSLLALVAGIVVLDLGIQGAHISNQAMIYRLRPQARSRLTTAYMTAVFLGGVIGSLLSATIYAAAGWPATCVLGAAIAGAATLIWAGTWRLGSARGR